MMNEQNEQIRLEAQEAQGAQSSQSQEPQQQKWWQRLLSELKSKDKPFYKKKWVWIAAAVVVVFAIFLFRGDPVQDDLIDYINNDLPSTLELEEDVHNLYETARASSDDYTTYMILDEQVIPKSMEWTDAVEAIEPETEEVRELHEFYIEAANQYNQAFTILLAALEEQDYALVAQANEKITAADKAVRSYKTALENLMEEHDVVWE